ncbi:acyloxyacyl hydrolase [Paludibacterium paludis]|uniref:Lipid A deacylase n=1 Tax=Paludibacterium paludis TaxID=1225769 RepID=A0A918U9T3_9NEIS|nr:acyloxyacyl hydrolase [Paludibacterium paludis]GGY17589.1 lipid A deacylase [Paludibacterium paludis]
MNHAPPHRFTRVFPERQRSFHGVTESASRSRALILLAIALALPATAMAEESRWGIHGALGVTDKPAARMKQAGIAAVWEPGLGWGKMDSAVFSMAVEGHLARWRPNDTTKSGITEIGVTPVLRLTRRYGDIRPYAEAGVGVRLLSHVRLSDTHTLSSAFQFADMIGAGLQAGNRQQYRIGIRFQHLSNAGIKRPNPGINFWQLYGQYVFG